MRESLISCEKFTFSPNSTFDMFQSYPYYRFLLHLYVQIHIIVVGLDWNVLELLKKPIIVRELVAQTKSREI